MRKISAIAGATVVLALLTGTAQAERKPSPEGAKVYVVWPRNGQTIPGGKFWLRMGLSGMGVAPAGTDRPNTGHHHVLIDVPLPPMDREIPNDKNHLHFGGGQTEARIELPPGKHTLQILFADGDHIPHDPPLMSPQITVFVPGDAAAKPGPKVSSR
jgi:Domain of unknown function (DUF4399)